MLFAAGAGFAEDWNYTLRPGDDLWSVARLHCGSASFAPRIARHNGLADPARLRAGTRLRIPVGWLVKQPASVEVLAVRGTVRSDDGAPIVAGALLEMGARLLTADGFALVRFADGTELEIGADSEVLFNVLTAHGASGMVDSHLRLYRGGGNVRVVRQGSASSFRVWTPTGIAAVRGTQFRLGVRRDASAVPTSRLETLTGAVDYEQEQTVAAVPAGTGLVASPSGVVQEPLLPAPQLEGSGALVLAADTVLRWPAVSGATAYRAELYDLAAQPLVQVAALTLEQPELPLAAYPPGRYRLDVRAVASSGLQGLDARRPLTLKVPRPQPQSARVLTRDEVLRWSPVAAAAHYVVELGTDRDLSSPQRYRSTVPSLPVADTIAVRPGQYFWRVKAESGPFSEPASVAVAPAAVTGLTVATGAHQNGRPLSVSWQAEAFVDYELTISGSGAEQPAVTTRIPDGAALPFVSDPLPSGTYTVEVRPLSGELDGPPETMQVEVRDPVPWWQPALLLLPLLLLL